MYIWEKYRTFEITSGIIFKMNLPLYKGFTLEITNKWWPLTTLNRWPLYRFKIYSKMHRESTKVTVMSRWPLWAGDHYEQVTIMQRWPLQQVWLYIVWWCLKVRSHDTIFCTIFPLKTLSTKCILCEHKSGMSKSYRNILSNSVGVLFPSNNLMRMVKK